MKKYISGLITGFIISLCMVGFAAELSVIPNPFPVLFDGVVTAVEGYNINGYTFLKLGDFKAAGLTAKLNETDKQIEITSATSTAAPTAQANTLTGGIGTMSTITAKPVSTPDGITRIDESDGKYYISFSQIQAKCLERSYDFTFDIPTEKWILKKDSTVILSDIPFINFHGRDSIEYNYYVNTILPLTE